LKEVAHVNRFASTQDFRVFLAEKPTHVGEEETSPGVVWIGVRLAKLVMHSMIPAPNINVLLKKRIFEIGNLFLFV
jgi:hypothetical protein